MECQPERKEKTIDKETSSNLLQDGVNLISKATEYDNKALYEEAILYYQLGINLLKRAHESETKDNMKQLINSKIVGYQARLTYIESKLNQKKLQNDFDISSLRTSLMLQSFTGEVKTNNNNNYQYKNIPSNIDDDFCDEDEELDFDLQSFLPTTQPTATPKIAHTASEPIISYRHFRTDPNSPSSISPTQTRNNTPSPPIEPLPLVSSKTVNKINVNNNNDVITSSGPIVTTAQRDERVLQTVVEAANLLTTAKTEEKNGNLKSAFQLYRSGLEKLLLAYNAEENVEVKGMLSAKYNDYRSRMDELQSLITTGSSQKKFSSIETYAQKARNLADNFNYNEAMATYQFAVVELKKLMEMEEFEEGKKWIANKILIYERRMGGLSSVSKYIHVILPPPYGTVFGVFDRALRKTGVAKKALEIIDSKLQEISSPPPTVVIDGEVTKKISVDDLFS